MSSPKVSVLVPVYNGEKFLADCLDSILAQDFQSMEILIADDGSVDGSPALVAAYAAKDERIRTWRNPQTLGLAGNFNACLRASRGEYIKFVLQDDKLLSSEAISRMARALDDDAMVSLVASASQFIDAASRVLVNRKMYPRSGVWSGAAAISKSFEDRGNPIGEPTIVMFRRGQAIRGFNPEFRYLIDLEMWFHLLQQGRLAYMAETLSAFRKHAGQESEICIQAGVFKAEYAKLLGLYAGEAGQMLACSRQALFTNIYYLRKWRPPGSGPLVAILHKTLGAGWYALYYCRHKLGRPAQKLNAMIKRIALRRHCER